jgi:hypothetical protein
MRGRSATQCLARSANLKGLEDEIDHDTYIKALEAADFSERLDKLERMTNR